MESKEPKQVEGEEPITVEEDAPAWQAGVEEAKEMMSACLKAAQEVCSDFYDQAGTTATGKPDEVVIGGIGVRKLSDMRQDFANIAITMYNSIVMMEMQRARADVLQMQKLIPISGVPNGYIIRP